jgi:hypothetical protein
MTRGETPGFLYPNKNNPDRSGGVERIFVDRVCLSRSNKHVILDPETSGARGKLIRDLIYSLNFFGMNFIFELNIFFDPSGVVQ